VSDDSPPSSSSSKRPRTVVAFGGNALLTREDHGTVSEQRRRAEAAARWLVDFARRDHDLAIVHGNGPQVGQVLIQMEEAATKVPPGTLDVAVAQTQGGMGFLLETALRNRLAAEGLERPVTTVLSLVVVDASDPGFEDPSKPIGPFFSAYRAEQLQRHQDWVMKEDSGRGWRKVVASPKPLEILGLDALSKFLDERYIVIAGGGGGVPVVRDPGEGGEIRGVEAVIDKDFTASLLARELEAELLINLTGVPRVSRNYGEEDEEPLAEMTVAEAREMLDGGQFPAGSMGPKIRASLEFVEATGNPVLITDIDTLPRALDGDGGTRIVKARGGTNP
jgi:carbamate kinase